MDFKIPWPKRFGKPKHWQGRHLTPASSPLPLLTGSARLAAAWKLELPELCFTAQVWPQLWGGWDSDLYLFWQRKAPAFGEEIASICSVYYLHSQNRFFHLQVELSSLSLYTWARSILSIPVEKKYVRVWGRLERWLLDLSDKVHYLWNYHGVWEKHAPFQKGLVFPFPVPDATIPYFVSHFQRKGTTRAEYPVYAVVKEKRRK